MLVAAIFALAGLLGAGVAYARRRTCDGYEDELGFHYGRPPSP